MKINLLVLLITFFLSFNCFGQTNDLPRRVDLHIKTEFSNPGILIKSIEDNSTELKNGLKLNDIIIAINETGIKDSNSYTKIIRSLRANIPYRLKINRNGEIKNLIVKFDAMPKEIVSGLDIEYDEFKTDFGYNVRTVISKSKNNIAKKMPAILFVQWLSCSSVENRGENHGFSNFVWGLSQNGYLVMRTEKPGVGDSQGPDCSELDFNTEVEVHRQALAELKKRSDVDANNIILVGGSMGSNIAAILASENPDIKALIFSGGYYKSWHERLIDFERRRLSYADKDPEEVYEKMLLYSDFYNDYFSENKKPSKILKEKPHLEKIWSSHQDLQYGRPVVFYQQANKENMGKIWSSITQPILALYGEYDWIMDKEDHQMIIEVSSSPDSKFVLLPRTDHNLYYYKDIDSKKKAFNNRSRVPNKNIANEAIQWLKTLR